MNTRKIAAAALLLLGLAAVASADNTVETLIDSIDAVLSESDSLVRPARQLQQATPTYPSLVGSIDITLDVFVPPPSDAAAFAADVAAEVCAAAAGAVPSGVSVSCTGSTGTTGRKLLQAVAVRVTVTIKFTPSITQAQADVVRAVILAKAGANTLFSEAFIKKWATPKAPSPPPAVTVVPCPTCKAPAASPPPPPLVTVIACPPPPVSTCTTCGGKTPSPVAVPRPCTHCKTPSPVATPSPCKTPSPVATPSPCKTPSPVATPSPCKTPSPVATPSPCKTPSPVATPSPKPLVPCGTTTKKVREVINGKKCWVTKKVAAYCPSGRVCCDVPRSWGKKSWGPKAKKGGRSQKRCYRKCPTSCWY